MICVREIAVKFGEFATGYYRKPSGRPTSEARCCAEAMTPLVFLFGDVAVSDLSPAHVRRVQQYMTDGGLARTTINARVRRIRRVVKWAISEGLCPPLVLTALQCVAPLKRGRCAAREPVPIQPVSEAVARATAEQLREPLRSMLWVHWWTGMRSGELTSMRRGDVQRDGESWLYVPREHKTEHTGRARVIAIGPRAQAALAPWLDRQDDPWLFPGAAIEEFVFVSKRNGKPFSVSNYRQAIKRAALRASVPTWCPLQVRHAAATRLRRLADLETARAVLGHSKADTTEIYAEVDKQRAVDAMALLG